MTSQKNGYGFFQGKRVIFFLFVAALAGLCSVAEAKAPGSWEAVHEPADDKTITSTAYIANESGDRISFSINAAQKRKACVLKLGILPLLPAEAYRGKMIIDNVPAWEGKIVSAGPLLGELLVLDLGFDWSQLLKDLKKGGHLVITYESDTQQPVDLKFTLKGSTGAINAMLDKQTELIRARSEKKK